MANGAILGQTSTVDAYTKEQTLTATTAALYGLGSDAVPDDVLAWIGKYNQHWWKRRAITFDKVEKNGSGFIFTATSTVIGFSMKYSDSVEVSEDDTGNITLAEPINTLQISNYTDETNARKLIGKYFYPVASDAQAKEVAYILPGTQADKIYSIVSSQSPKYCIACSGEYMKTVSFEKQLGDWEYVQSPSRSAYPDSGEQDGYEYQYLGIPFENAASSHVQIATGSYTGTGTYGESNPNSLTFDGKPLLVIVRKRTTGDVAIFYPFAYDSSYKLYACTDLSGTNLNPYQNTQYAKISGNTMSWYSTKSESYQFNTTTPGYNEYDYIAFLL